MGFFDKLKKAVDKIEDVKAVIEKVADAVEKSDDGLQKSGESAQGGVPSVAEGVISADRYYSETYNTGDEHFAQLITKENFPGYEIKKNIHATDFDSSAHPSCYPVSYMFYSKEEAVLAVLVMNTNQYRSMIARGTYKVLDEAGISYIRFYRGMENNRDYVIGRIKEHLK